MVCVGWEGCGEGQVSVHRKEVSQNNPQTEKEVWHTCATIVIPPITSILQGPITSLLQGPITGIV
jgi:branched-subunit amino acid aminotransferase/4-amino-4-deoxychorismate lyase